MEQTVIPAALLARLLAEAAARPAQEVCGLLFGSPDRVDTAEPTANVADDPARTFEIDPATLLRAYKAARAGGPQVIGHYHSHPFGSAVPSDRDWAAAEPGRLWLILADGAARLWCANATGFEEWSIRMV
ncbi:proteasome lid subunit RPN8/RPN11 [Sphingomonas vulcanisoli]|uniref:Proteasome lid subunit RPN8/RPN11 n=1 Tax=Sphingomonas vulcanisoli TaxID=1658060 RepID=A0ABX0TWR6_9SPHN|nr:M67 family metallopeptidase [Sphingomonas vulcanisoli]NIJ08885.1 proteasome lid subunit RPN8/RPN11 [Sphingomonas vulcanisoli]